jgi:hypothetical protein
MEFERDDRGRIAAVVASSPGTPVVGYREARHGTQAIGA